MRNIFAEQDMENIKLDTIEEALEDFREGKFVIVVDDEDRENEGDLIIAAEKITPEKVNFMLKHARGVLCAPITMSRCDELDLPRQVEDNTSVLGTPFTVTVDKLEGCTTGVSAHDRAATILALADPASTPQTFGRPGHINPLYAQDHGVLRRSGHTEATVDLCKLAGLYPAGALMEIMNEDGTMARLPELRAFADGHGLKVIAIKDLIAYRLRTESLIEVGTEVDMPTAHGHFKLIPFRQTSSGLERDYITQWSYGIGETWTLLVPNTKGGASFPLTASKTAMKKADPQFAPIYQAFGQYWGEQPGTSGPVYVGAFVLMLFVLGLFIVKGPMKWALLIATILSILLSWGKNFMGFTDFFLDYVPMYDKFRTVASILVIAEFTIPLLAMLALKEIVEKPEILKTQFKAVCGSFAVTGGIALLFALLPDVFFGQYISTAEYSMLQGAAAAGYIPGEYLLPIVNNLEEMRRAVFVEDAWRSFFVVFLGALLLLAFYMKKINKPIFIGTLIALCLVDLWQVDKRYLNDGMFSEPVKDMKEMVKTPADEQILKDPQLYYRVLNLTTNTFNENNTSFFHKSVGGYHAAKLRRYQEMIEEHITPEMSAFASAATQVNGQMDQVNGDSIYPVLDMLNVKYVIMGQQGGQSFPVLNPHVNGNGWFVSRVKYVPNADEEILSLHHEPLKEVAIVDQRFKEQLGNAAEQQPKDSLSRVELTKYDANALTYEVNSSKGGVVVFSEIYYPGWTATVDGEPVEIARANYILRAIQVPAGKHVVEFKFDPQSVHTTEAIAYTALAILFVGFLFLLYREIRRKKVQKD